ncbi:MAG: response regulator [Anaerolineaceae bacterium]|nr:response regulator [Anaerolineaceae bacterium]
MKQNSQINHVLVVDDDPDITYIVSMGLKKFNDYSIIDTAHSGQEAITKIQEQSYNLIITDYHMPDMTGFDVAESVRQLSPQTQIVMMTAYGSAELQAEAENALDGYINKPFSVKQIREIVEDALNRTAQEYQPAPQTIDRTAYVNKSNDLLRKLQANTSAQCILLIDASGYMVSAVGTTVGLDTTTISALVAANFTASIELANLLGSRDSIFKSSFFEGIDYNVYAYDINRQLLLAVIFGPTAKPGVVWYYTKQTAGDLAQLYEDQPVQLNLKDADLGSAFELELDNMFDGIDQDPQDNQLDNPPQVDLNPEKVTPVAPVKKTEPQSKPMTFEQAVAAGLVPQNILQREQVR